MGDVYRLRSTSDKGYPTKMDIGTSLPREPFIFRPQVNWMEFIPELIRPKPRQVRENLARFRPELLDGMKVGDELAPSPSIALPSTPCCVKALWENRRSV